MKLTERVYLVGGSGYGLSPSGDCNIYLVDGGTELALIDTGGGYGVSAILENIRKDGLDPKRITKTLITHSHFDHIGGNYDIKEETGTELFCHPADREAIEALNEYSLYTMAQQWGLEFKAVPIDRTVEEGDIVKVGDVELKVVHNPGHNPGCISFLLEKDSVTSLLCGDIAGASGRLGYINGPGFSLDEWKKSIKKLVELSPQRLYPGHGTFLLADAPSHLKLYDQKMNAAWTTIITEVG
jgi:glyoxylase-like metal-dependent hydrolase (beta-lactamase superfamily II)